MAQQPHEFTAELRAAVSGFGLDPLTQEQLSRLARHYELMCRWNARVNLTRITRPDQAARLHYAESIFGARFIEAEKTILDIGSGAGFPAIPMAVVRPDLEVTALEANQKKSHFLNEARDALGLANLSVVTARLEEFDWSGFDVLTSRALEKAETVFQSVIEEMNAGQTLMLYCAGELAARLEQRAGGKCRVTTHAIPHSESRVVAIFRVPPCACQPG
jgi:16S rRNA (guanine(527)-N(7))-methyltransferase RsmG